MDTKAELRQAIRRKDDAYRTGDIPGYLKAYASDITVFFAGTLMTFDEMRRLMADQFAGGGKTLDFQIADPDNIQFSDGADAAIVSYPWRERFRYGDGRETDTEYHETNVWYRRNGEWRLVHIHLSTIAERTISA